MTTRETLTLDEIAAEITAVAGREPRETRDGALTLGALTVYWDESDPHTPGWAYRLGDEDSGCVDDLDDVRRLAREVS